MPLTEEEKAKGYQTYKFMNETAVVDLSKLGTPQELVRRYTNPTSPAMVDTPTTTPASNISTPSLPTAELPVRPTLGTVDEATIREQTRQRMQASIDAINAQYTNLVAQENVRGEDRAGQTRAINARSGLLGSDFGASQAAKTEEFNKTQVKYLADEQNAKIQAVMQNIEDRASAEIQAKKDEALQKYNLELGEYKDTQEELRQRQTQAKGDLETLAKSGFNLGTLAPNKKDALFRDAGYEPAFGELVFNALRPKPQQIDYKFEKLAEGQGMFYGIDPLTGELKTHKISVDLPPDWQMQIAPDGTVIGYDKNTGEAKVLSEQGQFAKPEDPIEQAYKQAQIDKIYYDIGKGEGDTELSYKEAMELGVPIGTTKSQIAGMIPGAQEKAQEAETGLVTVNKVLSLIDQLKNHPGLDGATGLFGSRINIFGNSRDFVAKFDQLKSLLSLESISKLKGTGAISDAEQMLLANSATALRRDGDKNKLLDELDTLRNEVADKQQRLQNIINVGSSSLINEFEAQFGGSEGINPKAQSTTKLPTSNLSVNTQSLAKTVLPKFPTGSRGGQCVTFLHKIAQFPSIGDGKKEKFASVDKYGIPANKLRQNPQVGMIIITGENKTYGHGAMINAISPDGKYARLTESNFKGNERVSHDRVIALDSPQIYGAIIPKSLNNMA